MTREQSPTPISRLEKYRKTLTSDAIAGLLQRKREQRRQRDEANMDRLQQTLQVADLRSSLTVGVNDLHRLLGDIAAFAPGPHRSWPYVLLGCLDNQMLPPADRVVLTGQVLAGDYQHQLERPSSEPFTGKACVDRMEYLDRFVPLSEEAGWTTFAHDLAFEDAYRKEIYSCTADPARILRAASKPLRELSGQ